MKVDGSHLILDACCVLNFAASEYLLEILSSLELKIVIAQTVYEQELQSLQRLKENNPKAEQFQQAIDQSLIELVDFQDSREESLFIDFIFALKDDGESATAAIATHRGWPMATDDKRATAYFRREVPDLVITNTLEIIKFWSETKKINSNTLSYALKAIRVHGKYMPHKTHSLKQWWDEHMS